MFAYLRWYKNFCFAVGGFALWGFIDTSLEGDAIVDEYLQRPPAQPPHVLGALGLSAFCAVWTRMQYHTKCLVARIHTEGVLRLLRWTSAFTDEALYANEIEWTT